MQNWLAKSKFVENTEASILWAEENHDMNFRKHKKFWKRWEKKSDKYIAKRTLEESDGI